MKLQTEPINNKVKVSFVNIFDEKMNFNSNFVRYKDFPSEEDLSIVEDIYIQKYVTS